MAGVDHQFSNSSETKDFYRPDRLAKLIRFTICHY